METAKQTRITVRGLATKLFTKIETILLNEKPNLSDLEESLDELSLKEDQLKGLDTEVQKEIKDVKELEKEIIKCDEYLTKLVKLSGKIRRAIERCKSPSTPPISARNESSSEIIQNDRIIERISLESPIKLPRLTIENFTGDPCDWNRFWDQFESAIHKNKQLSNVDRFNYLKSFLSDRASDAIKGFTLTNDNYESAIETLKERYGDKSLVINFHMNKLLTLNPVKNSKDILGLRQLLDTCQTEIRNLKALGVNYDNYSLLSPIIIKCLPSDIVLEITKQCGSNEKMQITQILDALKTEVTSREKAFSMSNDCETSSQLI